MKKLIQHRYIIGDAGNPSKCAFLISLASDRSYELKAVEKLNVKQIQALNDSEVLRDFACELQQPINVEYIAENATFRFLSRSVESFAQSMIIAPLRSGRDVVGAVIVVHGQPFSFESDDVQAVSAFASSASVAIENARLVEDSLERRGIIKNCSLDARFSASSFHKVVQSLIVTMFVRLQYTSTRSWRRLLRFLSSSDSSPCVLIADVSGKGISAAFYMAKLKGVALALARQAHSVQRVGREHQCHFVWDNGTSNVYYIDGG